MEEDGVLSQVSTQTLGHGLLYYQLLQTALNDHSNLGRILYKQIRNLKHFLLISTFQTFALQNHKLEDYQMFHSIKYVLINTQIRKYSDIANVRERDRVSEFYQELFVVVVDVPAVFVLRQHVLNLQSHVIEDVEKPDDENTDLDNTGKSLTHFPSALKLLVCKVMFKLNDLHDLRRICF